MKTFTQLPALLLFLLLSLTARAQIDQEFWFVAPEVDGSHGDQPNYFRFTTMNGVTAHVEISQPANTSFTPITVTVPASSANVTVDLTASKSYLENQPPNQVLNKGILIRSDQPITAYYEESSANNPEIFTLKGRNALGTYFMTPFQTAWPNALGYSGFDIVATEDSTFITITNTTAITGHAANSTFTIMLNRGETYSAQATGQAATNRPAGSIITSTKPIAVTIKDDSVYINGCADLTGDQLIPVPLTGTEYIAVQGYMTNATDEKAFILATQNGTNIYLNGNTTPAATLNKGQQYTAIVNTGAMRIQSDKPVYVMQVSGIGCEVGGPVLPPITCTGSKRVGFTRSSSGAFAIFVAVPRGGETHFKVDGSTTVISPSWFADVPGTGGQWRYMTKQGLSLSTTTGHIIENDTLNFHFGLLNNISASMIFGFFSSYSNLNLGPDGSICPGDSLGLIAGWDNDSVVWSTGQRGPKIFVKNAGSYWARLYKTGCVVTDTINLNIRSVDSVDFITNDAICQGNIKTYDLTSLKTPIVWSNGDTSKIKYASKTGWLNVKIKDIKSGCYMADSAFLLVRDSLKVKVPGKDYMLCQGQTYNARAWATGGDSSQYHFLWQNKSKAVVGTLDTISLLLTKTDTLKVTISDGCSVVPDSTKVSVILRDSLKASYGIGQSPICIGQSSFLSSTAKGGDSSYQFRWYNGSGALLGNKDTITVWPTATSTYTLVADDGCTVRNDSVPLTVVVRYPLNTTVPANDTLICKGQILTLKTKNTGGDSLNYGFKWTDSAGNPLGNADSIQIAPPVTTGYKIILSDGCTKVNDTLPVRVRVRQPLDVTTAVSQPLICKGQSTKLSATATGGDSTKYTYNWYDSAGNFISTGQTSWVTPLTTTTYKVILSDACTVKNDTAFVSVTVRPGLNISATASTGLICIGQPVFLKAKGLGGLLASYSFRWYDGAGQLISSKDTVTVAPPITTIYKAVLEDGCTVVGDSLTLVINVRAPLQVSTAALPDHVCSGKQTELTATGDGGDSTYTYKWYDATGNYIGNANPLKPSVKQTTTFKVIMEDGCTTNPDSSSILITAIPYPHANLVISPDSICAGDSLVFTNLDATPADSIAHLWMFKTDSINSGFGNTITHPFEKAGKYFLTLRLTNSYNCNKDTLFTNLTEIYPQPFADLKFNPHITSISNPHILFINNSRYSISDVLYFGDGFNTGSFSSYSYTYNDTGTYYPQLVVLGRAGCMDTAYGTIVIKDDYSIFIPNAFTPAPGETTLNDFFRPSFTGVDKIKLSVFNRWGELLYEEEPEYPFQLQGWDGCYKGETCIAGTYTYVVNIQTNLNKRENYKGVITLLR